VCRLCVVSHRKDQEVCARVVSLMAALAPHLAGSQTSSALREAQTTVLRLTSAFWWENSLLSSIDL